MSRIVLGILLLALAPQMVFAKDKANQSWENLNRLQAGQKVQVMQMDLKSMKGQFLGFTDEMISLRIKKDEVAVPREDVFRVSLRGKRKRGASALAGTALGFGLGAVAGAAFGGGGEPGLAAFVFAIGGAGVGAGVGAAVPFIRGYETIYRAKRIKRRKTR